MRILQDIRLVAIPSKLCGILPVFLDKGEDVLIISKFGKIYTFILTSTILISSAFFTWDVLFNSRYYKIMNSVQGDTVVISQTIETLFCIICYTMIVVSCVYNTAAHCRTLKDIARIDELLVVGGFEGVYETPILTALLLFVSLGVVVVAFYYIHFRSPIAWSNQFVLLTSYTLQMLFSSTFALYLRIVLKNLARRIQFVNQKLGEFAHGDICYQENWRDLSNLIEIFCKFRYITENINSVTSVGLLFYMGYAFYTVTNQSYLAFSTLTTHVGLCDKFDGMGLSVTWVIAKVTIMSVICDSCDALSSEANKTSQILARVYGKSKEYQNIIDKFLTKSIKQEVQFTAYGFFVIDNSTLFKIFSAVTTYLVILIQFKQLEDSKAEDKVLQQQKQ